MSFQYLNTERGAGTLPDGDTWYLTHFFNSTCRRRVSEWVLRLLTDAAMRVVASGHTQ